MTLTLYGGPRTRASMPRWYLEEKEIPYDLVELDLRGNAMGAAGGTSLVPALQYATALRCDGCLFAFRRFSSSSASVRTSTHSGPSVDCVACVCALRHGRALHCAIALHHLSPTQNPKP